MKTNRKFIQVLITDINFRTEAANKGKKMTKKKIINSSFVALSLLAFGCAKERQEEFSQGQGRNLLNVSEYNGKTFELTTTSVVQSESTASSATRSLDVGNYDGMNNMMIVEYTTDAPLFQGFTFRGLPNHKYEIQYEVTDKYLVVNKVANKDAIPFDELTYATQLKDGRYKVPLLGYPIRLVSVENIQNSYGEDSRKLMEMSQKSVANSSHFEIASVSSYELFAAQQKIDVFPADFFEGQWFYAATIVSASTKNATSIGRDLSVDAEADSVSRIEFKKYKDSVLAYNLNLDQIISREDDINLKKAFKVPVNWIDYKRETINGQVSMKEVALDNNNKEAKNWEDRRFMKIDFKNVSSLITDGVKDGVLQKLEVAKDFISWTIWYPSEEIRVKFALRRAHKPIAGRVYRKSDFNNFGFFKTYKHYIKNHRQYRDEDFDKLVLLNRFNPENKVIEYYFSTNTSKEMREVGRKGIEAWNHAFQEAGTGIKVVLNESRDVELGDIRYNILNIVDTKDGSGLLGYGPSISDSESGEIISATTNIYANPFREGLIANVRNYIKKELGKYETTNQELLITSVPSNRLNSTVGGVSGSSSASMISSSLTNSAEFKVLLENSSKLTSNAEELGLNAKVLEKQTNEIYKLLNIKKSDENEKHNHENSSLDQLFSHGTNCSYAVVDNDSYQRIAEQCSEVNDYVKDLASMPGKPTYDAREIEVVEKCANKLLEENVLSTVVHELGHNFGLRHNFSGSNDPENFSKDKSDNVHAMTSSIMDYLANDVAELVAPGKYDVAAIKFGYAEKIDTVEGQEISVANKSIEEAIAESGLSAKPYKFCTDEHVSLTDPLCTRWDQGSNPEEVVDHIIADFKSFVALYGRKYDRAFSPSQNILANKMLNSVFSLKAIHDQWRYYVAKELGESNKYLQGYDSKSFQALVKDLNTSDSEIAKGHQRYLNAATKAYEFLKEVAFHSAKTCELERNDGSRTVLDFEQARQRIWGLYSKNVYACSDIASIIGQKLVAEGGYILNDIKVSNNPGNKDDYLRNQIAGLEAARQFAMLGLVIRIPMIISHSYEGFYPNFMDNPVWRNEIMAMVQDRIINGVDKKSLGEAFAKNSLAAESLEFFATEKDLIVSNYASVAQSLYIPGDTEASMERAAAYYLLRTRDERVIPQGFVRTTVGSNYVAAPAQSPTGQLIDERNQLDFLRDLSKTELSDNLVAAILTTLDEKLLDVSSKVSVVRSEMQAALEKRNIPVNPKILSHMADDTDSVITVKEAIARVKHNEQELTQMLQTLIPRVGYGIQKYLAPFINGNANIGAILEGLVEQDATVADKKLNEVLMPLIEQNQLNVLNAFFQQATPKEMILQESVSAAKEYRANSKELDAKLDAITKILMSI